jgi:ankyrin repeat protein
MWPVVIFVSAATLTGAAPRLDALDSSAIRAHVPGALQTDRPRALQGEDPDSLLSRGVVFRDIGLVRQALEAGARVNAQDTEGLTPLMRAVMQGDPDVVGALLATSDIEVNLSAPDGSSVMAYAALYGQGDAIVRALIAHRASVDAEDKEGVTPLMVAAQQGRLDVVRQLVDAGAKVSSSDKEGVTALMLAASSNHADIALHLLSRGADLNAKTREGSNALMAAAFGGCADVVRVLLPKGADSSVRDRHERTTLMAAALSGDTAVVEALLAGHPDLEVQDDGGLTALSYAALYQRFAAGQLLAKAGAVKGRNELLITAAADERLEIVTGLLGQGVNIDARDDTGSTALIEAAFNDKAPMAGFLIAHGADANAADAEGRTPLMGAAQSGDAALVQLLLRGGAHADTFDKAGANAWNYAMRRAHSDVAKILENAGGVK